MVLSPDLVDLSNTCAPKELAYRGRVLTNLCLRADVVDGPSLFPSWTDGGTEVASELDVEVDDVVADVDVDDSVISEVTGVTTVDSVVEVVLVILSGQGAVDIKREVR